MTSTFRRASWLFLLMLLASLTPWAFAGDAGLEQTQRLLRLVVGLAAATWILDGLVLAGGRAWTWWKARRCRHEPAQRPPRPREAA